jgi:hypothetical protein
MAVSKTVAGIICCDSRTLLLLVEIDSDPTGRQAGGWRSDILTAKRLGSPAIFFIFFRDKLQPQKQEEAL